MSGDSETLGKFPGRLLCQVIVETIGTWNLCQQFLKMVVLMMQFVRLVAGIKQIIGLALALPSLAAYSAEAPHQWDGSLSIGLENDSTVIIDELDTVVDEDSVSRLMRINIDYQYQPDEKNEWQLSGNYIVKNLKESDQFDSALQIYSAAYSHESEQFTIGIRTQLIDSDLNDENFLRINQISPYISFFIGKQWFLNIALSFNNKSIENNVNRSANSLDLSVDSYRFIQGINNYLLFSYKTGNENAKDPLFSQVFNQVRVGWVRKLRILDRVNKLRINWRYLHRNYNEAVHPDIDTFRVDNRRQWELEWELELNPSFMVSANYRLNEQDSSLSLARYDQHISGVSLEYRF